MIRLVVAGPGTGKTTFVTTEIKKLLDKGIDPSKILALTFTEKAAEEMLGRLDEAMPLGYEPPWLLTFHGFCERILKERGWEIGLDSSYKIITPPLAWIMLRKNLYRLPLKYFRPLGNPTKFLRDLLELFSRAKDEGVTAQDYLVWAKRQKQKARTREEKEEAAKQLELGKVYAAYQKLLLQGSYLDFGDLILWTIKLFSERPSVLSQYRQQFKYMYVDEFQDTNVSQASLVGILVPSTPTKKTVGPSANLTVVGDDDQAIYKWRGASISNILEFKKKYPQAKTSVLNTSYRLTDRIAQSSYKLIRNNNPFRLEDKLPNITKNLKTKKTGPVPQVLYAKSAEGEAEAVLRKIVELMNGSGKSYADFAILARANAHLEPFISALKRHEMPFQIVGNRGLFEQDEVAALLAVLRVVIDPQNYIAWYKVLSIPAFGISPQTVVSIINKLRKEHASYEDVLAKDAPAVLHILQKIIASAPRISPSHLLFDFVSESGYAAQFSKVATIESQLKIENVSLFFERIQAYEAEIKNPTIFELVEYLDMLVEAGESPSQATVEDVDTINLLTVHSAKGLEFPVVFLVCATADRFPTRRRGGGIGLPENFIKERKTADWKGIDPQKADRLGHLQEERRLFYVGLTRAGEEVYVTFAKNYGGVQDKRPSPFIAELGLTIPPEPQNLLLTASPAEPAASQDLPIKELIPDKFSYSQLDTYETCPWKYRYQYVLRIPAPPTPPLSFGSSVHEALREFELKTIKGEKPSLKILLKIYEEHFSFGGYRDQKEKQEYYREGKKMLTNFYRVGLKKLAPAFMVEKSFAIKIGPHTITGRIDRVGKDAGGNFELIDFKTGAARDKDPQELARRAKKDDQLLLYTLASQEVLGITPKRIGLFYLDGGTLVEVEITKEDLAKRQEDLKKRLGEIAVGNFKATPGPQCAWCPFNQICEFSQADRYR
ncbi:MAG: ATP-dependent DNA helicase [Patescibacteria group bacterium]